MILHVVVIPSTFDLRLVLVAKEWCLHHLCVRSGTLRDICLISQNKITFLREIFNVLSDFFGADDLWFRRQVSLCMIWRSGEAMSGRCLDYLVSHTLDILLLSLTRHNEVLFMVLHLGVEALIFNYDFFLAHL